MQLFRFFTTDANIWKFTPKLFDIILNFASRFFGNINSNENSFHSRKFITKDAKVL